MNEGREVNVAEETPPSILNLFQFIFRSTHALMRWACDVDAGFGLTWRRLSAWFRIGGLAAKKENRRQQARAMQAAKPKKEAEASRGKQQAHSPQRQQPAHQ